MKKILGILALSLFMSGSAYAEIVLLKCEYEDGKLQRYKNNKPQKVEKDNAIKEYEIKLDLALETVTDGPGTGYGSTVFWKDDFITWMSDNTVVGPYDMMTIASLNRFNGKLIIDRKSFKRVVEDGHFQTDSNGNWIRNITVVSQSEYQCKKQDKLF
jgi:hypothetical protein